VQKRAHPMDRFLPDDSDLCFGDRLWRRVEHLDASERGVASSDVPTIYSLGSRLSWSESFSCFCFLLDLTLAFDLAMRKVAAGFRLFGSR